MNAPRLIAVCTLFPGSSLLRADEWKTTFNGQERTMFESYHGLDFGLGPISNDAWTHQRVQAMAIVEKDNFLLFAAELTWGKMWSKQSPLAPPDQDHIDFLQLHAQARFSLSNNDILEIRAGRQDLYYGSGRLLASREGANQRLSHDALRLSWQRNHGMRIDAFVASPVAVHPAEFDNGSDPSEVRFWGLYATFRLGHGHLLDSYYIGLRDEDSIFTGTGGHETRQTFGIRYSTDGTPLICNTELIFQCGQADGHDILAGAASLGIGYAFEDFCWKPSLILRADAISGGDGEGTGNTFNPLFQANNYFNEGGFISPSNLYNLNPVLVLKPRENVALNLGVNFQWRFDADDSIYGAPLQVIGGPAADGETYLGTAFNFSMEWNPLPATTLFLGYTHHHAGPSLTGVGGTDVDYLQLSLRQEF